VVRKTLVREAVKGISFSIEEGEMVILTSHNTSAGG
jgi:ABC-type multidrug transport system ATPase subunit